MTDVVVFRRWKDTGDIIALFPEIPADNQGWYCVSYEHIGQHGAADYQGVLEHTTSASPQEYARLARELTLLGYNLQPIRRASHRHHQRRLDVARAVRQSPPTSND